MHVIYCKKNYISPLADLDLYCFHTVQSGVKLTILPVHGRSSPGPRSFRSRSTVVPVNIAVSVGPFQSLHYHHRRSVPFHSFVFALL